jgi:hypothetical protein
MATLAELQEQREAVLTQMSQAQSVAIEGRSLTNRSQADLEAALRRIDREIAALSSSSSSRVFVVQSERGI